MSASITETTYEKLPLELKASIDKILSDREIATYCLIPPPYMHQPLFGKAEAFRGVLVVTNYRVILAKGQTIARHVEDGSNDWKTDQSIWLEKIVSPPKVKKSGGMLLPVTWVINIDSGEQYYIEEQDQSGRVSRIPMPNYWLINFDKDNQEIAERLASILSKASANASIRARTPVSKPDNKIPDVADQLTKLAALHKSGDISLKEFEAAKRKLLGL